MFSVRKLFGHWFCDHFYGNITSKGYFNCYFPSCPFSVKLVWPNNDDLKAVVEKVIFSTHCHEFPEYSRRTSRLLVEEEQRVIERGEDVEETIADKHKAWQEKAEQEGKAKHKSLSDRDDVIDYACQHPQLSGREVEQNTGEKCHGSPQTWPVCEK